MMEQADSHKEGVGKDHQIDFEEFASIWQRKLLTLNDKYIQSVFEVLDSDGNNQISVDELMEVFKTDKKASLEMLVEVDTNKDGLISKEEFISAMKEKIQQGEVYGGGPTLVGGEVSMEELLDLDVEKDSVDILEKIDEFDEREDGDLSDDKRSPDKTIVEA